MAVKLLGDLSASGNATFNSEVNLPSGGQIDWANGDARIIEGAVTNYSLSLQTYTGSALTTKMFIASGGNVGIGSTAPSEKLHVVGNGLFHSGANLGRIKVGRSANQEIEIYVDDTNNIITAYQDSDSNNSHVFALDREFDGSGANYFEIRKGGSAQMHIDTSGNVGIGTTAPLEKLHVVGKINSSNNIVSNSTYTMFTGRSSRTVDDYGGLNKEYFKANLVTAGPNTTGEASAHGFADLRFQLANSAGNTGMSDIMTLRSGGNVGIGTATPAEKLTVAGKIHTIGGTNNGKYAQIHVNDSWAYYTTNAPNIYMNADLRVDTGKIGSYNEDLELRTSGTTRITALNSNGNVGIGTTSPIDELHVEGVIQSKKQLLPSTSGTAGWYKIGTLEGFVQGGATAVIEIAGHQGYNATNTQDYLIKLFIKTSNGNAGGPNGQGFNSWYERTGGNNGHIEFKWNNSATNDYDLYMYIPTHNLRSWYSVKKGTGTWEHAGTSATDPGANSASVLKATSLFNILDTNVGIGTTSPAQKLHVAGNQVRLDTAAGGYYLHNASGTFRGAFHDNGTTTNIFGDGNGSTAAISIESGNSTFAGIVGVGSTGIYAGTNAALNLPGKGIALKNDKDGSNNNWSYINNTATAGSSNINFATGQASSALTLAHNGNATFAGSVSIQSDNEERFLIRSNDYTISRIISRGNSGADLDKGLFSLMSSDGTNNNVEKVRIDSAGSSWFNGGAVSFGDNVTITGNLTVDGTTTTLNTTTVEVEDNILQLNTTQGTPDTATAATSGISIYRGDGVAQASLIFDDADDTWDLTNNLAIAGNLEVQGSVIELLGGFSLQGTNGTYFQRIKTIDSSASDPVDTFSFDVKLGASAPWKSLLVLDQHDDARFSGSATFAGNVTLSSTAPILYLANTTSSTGKTWRLSSAANGNAYITQDGVIDAITLSHTSGNATFAGRVSHTGLEPTSGFGIDQIREFPMTFQLTANTWADTGIDGADLSTGTYAMQVYVSDFEVGGNHYYEYYSATITWYGGATNSTVVDEIPVHRAGHATNDGDLQFRTQRASGSDSHDLMLQVKHNKSYTGALDNDHGGKIMRFKFRRLM